MKVLVLAWNYVSATGGLEHMTRELAHGLRKRGHELLVFARYEPSGVAESDVIRPTRKGMLPFQGIIFRKAFSVMRRFRADVIVSSSVVTAPWAWLLSRVHRVPWVLFAYGTDVVSGGCLRPFVQMWFKKATCVMAISKATLDLLNNQGVRRERIHILHPGVDPKFGEPRDPRKLAEIRARFSLGEGPIILTVSRLIRRKGILEFIECVVPQLVRKWPHLRYVVAGGEPSESLVHTERLLPLLESRVRALGLGEQVRLLGEVSFEDLWLLYGLAHVFVLPVIPWPGDVEGFGIVLLEAALSGVPVVAANIGGIPDAVLDGETGVLVTPCDWQGFYESIARLLEDETLRRRLAHWGAIRAESEFVWPKIVEHYERILLSLCPNGA